MSRFPYSDDEPGSLAGGARVLLFGAALLALGVAVLTGRSSPPIPTVKPATVSSYVHAGPLPPRWVDSTQIVPARALDPSVPLPSPPPAPPGTTEPTGPLVARLMGTGRASYYGRSLAGNPTASGERFDPKKLTAAHPSLPFGAHVRVTNLRNERSVIVRINDRGPYSGTRAIDISRRAAKKLKMLDRGLARVRIELLKDEK